MQKWIVSLAFQNTDLPVDLENAQFRGHRAAAPHDHHDVGQDGTEFTRHNSYQERAEQLRLPCFPRPESELYHDGKSDKDRHTANEYERFDTDGQDLPRLYQFFGTLVSTDFRPLRK